MRRERRTEGEVKTEVEVGVMRSEDKVAQDCTQTPETGRCKAEIFSEPSEKM